MKGTKRLAILAMFTAIALTIFVAEAQIPPVVPIPGVKLGLANIVTLIAMALLGRRQAGEILLVRIVLGSVFTGGVSAMLFSIAGGVFAYLVMCLTIRRFPERLLWVVSVLAAFGHNAGQLLVAVWVTGTPSILVYAPALVAASAAQIGTLSAGMSRSCHSFVTFYRPAYLKCSASWKPQFLETAALLCKYDKIRRKNIAIYIKNAREKISEMLNLF